MANLGINRERPGIGDFTYQGINDGVTADPGTGNWKTNTANTRIELSATALDGLDVSSLIAALTGAHIYLRTNRKSRTYAVSDVTDLGTWLDITVTVDATGTGFALTNGAVYSLLPSGGGGNGTLDLGSMNPTTLDVLDGIITDAGFDGSAIGDVVVTVDSGDGLTPTLPAAILANLPSAGEGANLGSTGEAQDRILVTDGAGGFGYEDKPTSGIEAQADDTPVTGGPWDTINFINPTSVADGGGGVLDVTLPTSTGGDPTLNIYENTTLPFTAVYPTFYAIPTLSGIVPGAGTYLLTFSSALTSSITGTATAVAQIFANGVAVAASNRYIDCALNANVIVHTMAKVTVSAGQTVSARVSKFTAGTMTLNNPQLSILKVA